jgi:hypothetical protein
LITLSDQQGLRCRGVAGFELWVTTINADCGSYIRGEDLFPKLILITASGIFSKKCTLIDIE